MSMNDFPRPLKRYWLSRYATTLAFSAGLCLVPSADVRAQETSTIVASPATTIKSIVVRGTRVIDTKVVTNTATVVLGKQASSDVIRQAVDAVTGLYRKRGFVMAQVTDAEVTPDGQLQIMVAEGTIRNILIRGNRRTRTRTIRTVLNFKPGEIFQESAIRSDRDRLARLGIFLDVSITPRVPGSPEPLDQDDTSTTTPTTAPTGSDPIGEGKTAVPPTVPTPTATPPAGTPETPQSPPPVEPAVPVVVPAQPLVDPDDVGLVDVVVRVRERPTANIAATIGYTDNIGAVGFVDLTEDNLLGTAQRFSVQWQRTASTSLRDDGTIEAGDSRSALGISYDIPALRTSDFSFGGEAYNKNTVFLPYFSGGRETIRSYEERRGGRIRVGHAIAGILSGFVTARHDVIGYSTLPDRLNVSLGDVRSSRGTVGALGFGLIADQRDQVSFPQQGFRYSFLLESARPGFGGTFKFTQASLDLRHYVGLLPTRMAPNGKDKLPVPVLATRLFGGASTGTVPLQEMFYLGGPEMLRGYDLFSLYGETAVLGTAELRLPVGQGLQAVAFTDIGGVWEPTAAFSPRRLKAGIGAGLRFASPIGPIRLDAAYGNRLQTYVSLGQSF